MRDEETLREYIWNSYLLTLELVALWVEYVSGWGEVRLWCDR